ncbi:MAG: DUF5658 family protein [Planctomycetota bacterium]|nr:DUF5658 family protein [Planctomycetota bacterium]
MSSDPAVVSNFFSNPRLRYAPLIVVLLFVSALDVILTHVIIDRGGIEINPVANLVFEHWSVFGLAAFKYALVTFYIIIVQQIATMKEATAYRTMVAGIAISCMPVVWSCLLLATH